MAPKTLIVKSHSSSGTYRAVLPDTLDDNNYLLSSKTLAGIQKNAERMFPGVELIHEISGTEELDLDALLAS